MKIRPVGAEFHADRQIMTKLIVAFHSYANAPKTSFNIVQGNNRCLFSDPYKTQIQFVLAERKEFVNVLILVECKVTTDHKRINRLVLEVEAHCFFLATGK
jgi:hypothetical protein